MSEVLKQRYAQLRQKLQIWWPQVSTGEKIKWTIIAIFVVLFAWGVARQTADAAEIRLGLGRGASNDNAWIMQELMLTTDSHWYFGAAWLGGDDVLPDTMRFTAGYRVSWRDGLRVAPYMRGGMAYFRDEPTDIISDNWAYDMAVGLRLYRVVDLEYQHNSTAGRSLQNSGSDIPALAVVVPFGK